MQVAFAVLGIGLAGLCPLVVMQLRQVRQLELRLEGQVVQKSFLTGQSQTMLAGNTYYIVPWTNPLAQKLAGSGQILTSPTNSCDPGALPLPTPAPPNFPVYDRRARCQSHGPERHGVCHRLRALTPIKRGRTRAMRSSRATNALAALRFRGLPPARFRHGFSLIETMVASVLAAFLGILLALSCASFGRSAVEVESRARITQEGILAAQSLACDLGGFLADPPGRTGTLTQYPFQSWDVSQGTVLILYFQGSTPSDVIAVTYQLNGDQLIRTNSSSGITTTIARDVTAFTVGADPDNPSQALIQFTVAYRYFTSTYTLIGINPT